MNGRHSVVIVDDDDMQREVLEVLLTVSGYRVAAFADARQALQELRAGLRPCVIVLDLMMPVMSGEEFRREQQRDATLADVPVILFSSSHDLEQVAARLGVAHVPKLEPQALLRAVAAEC